MLYTCHLAQQERIKKKVKFYVILPKHGNDVVAPDESTLFNYRNGVITWQGFRLTYLSKLMENDATQWMQRVASEAVHTDTVLVDDEEDALHSSRRLLAELMINMFSGHLQLRYKGELNTH